MIYRLIYQNHFQNTKVYSLILYTNIDRESKSIYDNIQLIAHDSGTPTLHTRSLILLNITDTNDCIPQILTNTTIYNINEDNPIGLIIDTLNAYDCDVGINAKFKYYLLNKTELLNVNSQTGQLSLKQSIDFEQVNRQKHLTSIDLEFHVGIQDYGRPPLSSQTKITLRIHDLNDHAPKFDEHQLYNWTFSQTIFLSGSVLGRVCAYDKDSGLQGIIRYSIRSFQSCLRLNITPLGYVHVLSHLFCSILTFTFEITASDYSTSSPRSTKQLLTINLDSNRLPINDLPQILPLSVQRTIVDINSMGRTAFIIDITTNRSIQPTIYLNNTNLLAYWNISLAGEVRLKAKPYVSSSILSLIIIDEYAKEKFSIKLQIDLCNSSIVNSCKQLIHHENEKEKQLLLFWIISLALVITSILIFSLMTCSCCRKHHNDKIWSGNQQNCLQCNHDYQSEKVKGYVK